MKPRSVKARKKQRLSTGLEKSLTGYAMATVGLATVAIPAVAEANFSGPYAVSNWTFQNTGGSINGSVNTSGAPSSILLIGGSSGNATANGPGTTDFTITAVAAGVVSFNWTYSSFDSTDAEGGNFLLNGVPFLLSANYAGASGTFSIPVNQNDVFGFEVYSLFNRYGQGMLNISNFNAPTGSVPDSGSTLSLLALGASGLAMLRQRMRRPA
jgi:protein with PEP-CTERM/exosortase system signal